jgi:hypothetical protein
VRAPAPPSHATNAHHPHQPHHSQCTRAGAAPNALRLPCAPCTPPQAGRIAEAEGAAAITLHARTADQLYSPPADWVAVGELVRAVGVPVIGNGDVFEAADAIRMIRETGGAPEALGGWVGGGGKGGLAALAGWRDVHLWALPIAYHPRPRRRPPQAAPAS